MHLPTGILLCLLLCCFAAYAQNVGINTNTPDFDLDIRGTDDVSDGGELQLSTPSQSNFLRFFGGRLGDHHPFMAFNDNDTFHIVTTLSDWSTYTRRMTLLPIGNVGIGIDAPQSKLHVIGGQWNLPGGSYGDLKVGNSTMGLSIGVAVDGGGAGIARIYAKGGQAKLILGSDNTDIMTIDSANRVGIGTSPHEFLEIAGAGALAGRVFIGDGNGNNRKGLLIDAVEPGNYVRLNPYDYSTALNMDLYIPSNVLIGNTSGATGYKLSVDGKIIAEEMRIQLSGEWPDYVFAEDYPLPDLFVIEKSIRTNKHLPGVPPAGEIEAEGIMVGTMQATLLEKIEELMLYTIRQQHEIVRLSKEIESLKTR